MSWWSRLRGRLLPKPRQTSLGQLGERCAARYLQRQGYRIIARGERRHALGEVDLIAVDGRTVVFVEVKSRRSHDKGHPAEAVDAAKQRHLTRFALSYLKQHGLLENPARFDVVAVTWPDQDRRPLVQHIPNAFESAGRGQMFG